MNIVCWQCLTPFEPPKERVTAWVESNQDFDPTDWECPQCAAQPAPHLTLADSGEKADELQPPAQVS